MARNLAGAGLSRRGLGGFALAGMAACANPSWAKAPSAPRVRLLVGQREWAPMPPQAPVTDGLADLGDTKLYYWDTGGKGEPVILLHAFTGSAMNWGFQQPVLVSAGYRVIAYSRRGHAKSDPTIAGALGNTADDLNRLADFLKLDRFHAVGQSSGGSCLPDYAVSYGDRLLSMTMVCSSGRLTEPSYREMMERMEVTRGLSPSVRELSGSYRAVNPEGVKQWEALERGARQPGLIAQPAKNRTNFEDIEKIRTPALLMPGAADMTAPPSMMLTVAAHLPRAEVAMFVEAGHQAYWEQPIAFNREVIAFMRKHRG